MNKLARWSIMGRKDYNEALITVVKLSGVLQAFSGPARAPQMRGPEPARLLSWVAQGDSQVDMAGTCALSYMSISL